MTSSQGLFPEAPFDAVADARRILESAIAEHNPSHVFAMFSGGNDSICSAHLIAQSPRFSGCVHIHTGIGIRETRRHAYDAAKAQGWPFRIYRPKAGNRYHELVVAHGFPGPFHHRKMYNRLKERSIRRLINDHKRGSERILLVTGVRRQESKRRMGHLSEIDREGRRVWVAPIINWSTTDKEAYMQAHGLPGNPVTQKLCVSGECLCGAFASPGELEEIRFYYPRAAAKIDRLAEKCREAGVHDKWGQRPPPKPDPMQISLEERWLERRIREDEVEQMIETGIIDELQRDATLAAMERADQSDGAEPAQTGGLCWSCDARRGVA